MYTFHKERFNISIPSLENTLRLHHQYQPVNAIWVNNRCLP